MQADILIIDEALAVGDTFFVQKCMRFLRRFMEHGTLLFVSHDMGVVTNLCRSVLWLDSGNLRQFGDTKSVTSAYLKSEHQAGHSAEVKLESLKINRYGSEPAQTFQTEKTALPAEASSKIQFFENLQNSDGWKSGAVEIQSVHMLDREGKPLSLITGGDWVCLSVEVLANQALEGPIIGFFVKDRLGQALFGDNTFAYKDGTLNLRPGEVCEAKFLFKLPMLPSGEYAVTVAIAEGTLSNHIQHHWIQEALVFQVLSGKPRYGLVGIEFQSVSMNKVEPKSNGR
jgi:lipopolysaccharide transport system ATP-binding protein